MPHDDRNGSPWDPRNFNRTSNGELIAGIGIGGAFVLVVLGWSLVTGGIALTVGILIALAVIVVIANGQR